MIKDTESCGALPLSIPTVNNLFGQEKRATIRDELEINQHQTFPAKRMSLCQASQDSLRGRPNQVSVPLFPSLALSTTAGNCSVPLSLAMALDDK